MSDQDRRHEQEAELEREGEDELEFDQERELAADRAAVELVEEADDDVPL